MERTTEKMGSVTIEIVGRHPDPGDRKTEEVLGTAGSADPGDNRNTPESWAGEDTRLLELIQGCAPDEMENFPAREPGYRSLYQFSPLRQNLVQWLPIQKDHRVLELFASGGALTECVAGKAKEVTALDPSLAACRLNAFRNRDRENVRVIAGELPDVMPLLEGPFDVILIGDSLWQADGYLGQIFALLAEDGFAAAATQNRLGLKYWAGCNDEYTGSFFSGLEGYPEDNRERVYSRGEILRMLKEAGQEEPVFYYPWPDHLFPRSIYSDRYLPEPGELREFATDYRKTRIALFNEPLVTDSLLREGLYPEFCNSFLVIAGRFGGRSS